MTETDGETPEINDTEATCAAAAGQEEEEEEPDEEPVEIPLDGDTDPSLTELLLPFPVIGDVTDGLLTEAAAAASEVAESDTEGSDEGNEDLVKVAVVIDKSVGSCTCFSGSLGDSPTRHAPPGKHLT